MSAPTVKPLSLAALDTYAFERLLKQTARSFQLSLRILPSAVRTPLTIAYMLARASDTIADASRAPAFQRLALLRGLPGSFPESSPDLGLTGENLELVRWLPKLLTALKDLPDRSAIEAVWKNILEGQIFDVERFEPHDGKPASPLDQNELERYTWLVAGSVGEFWTDLCHRRIPEFSKAALTDLVPLAGSFGAGLQMVNILRDRRADAELGRIYVPDERFYLAMQQTHELLNTAESYVRLVGHRVLRASCALPLDLARQTLALVSTHPLGQNIKVSRWRVYLALGRAFFAPSKP